jgi:hypothetical protein
MSLPVSTVDNRPVPTDARIWKIIVDNGVNERYGQPPPLDASGNSLDFLESPRVEILIAGCIPILDENGDQKTNVFGQPCYTDTGHVASVSLSDPAELGTYLANVWGPLMTAGYTKIQPLLSGLQFKILW